jgi:hypothetical protein
MPKSVSIIADHRHYAVTTSANGADVLGGRTSLGAHDRHAVADGAAHARDEDRH